MNDHPVGADAARLEEARLDETRLAEAGLIASISEFIAEGAAPWVHELNMSLTRATPGDVTFVMPGGPHLVHSGGVICGQSIMAGMDTGMVFVMASLLAADTPTGDSIDDSTGFITVQLQTTFERGAPADTPELTFHAWATKTGRRLVFGQIDCLLPNGARCATATTQYMWLETQRIGPK